MNPVRFDVIEGSRGGRPLAAVGDVAGQVMGAWERGPASRREGLRVDLRGSGQVECVVLRSRGASVLLESVACEPDRLSVEVWVGPSVRRRDAVVDALGLARVWFRRLVARRGSG